MSHTSSFKFFNCSSDRIIIKAQDNCVLGFIKVGEKKYLIKDDNNNFTEKSPLCLFDFYVNDNVQRRYIGKV